MRAADEKLIINELGPYIGIVVITVLLPVLALFPGLPNRPVFGPSLSLDRTIFTNRFRTCNSNFIGYNCLYSTSHCNLSLIPLITLLWGFVCN